MILGIGNDLVSIERIKRVFIDKKRMEKIFTRREIDYFTNGTRVNMERLAGNFAAKEAFSKALVTGFSGFFFKDVEILRDDLGKPYLSQESFNNLRGIFLKQYNSDILKVHITISHEKTMAMANVIIEEGKDAE